MKKIRAKRNNNIKYEQEEAAESNMYDIIVLILQSERNNKLIVK